jgi:hypothetical protein
MAEAKEMSVSIPTNNIGKIDLYLDDNIAIALGEGDNALRVSNALITAVRTVSRPLDDKDQIPRKDIISLKKFIAEGTPSETKIVLGWLLNTRTLRISLTEHKFKAWHKDLEDLLSKSKVKEKLLEQVIGRLNYVACILDIHHVTYKGVSLNNLVFRKPTHILRSDSSLFGLGGYNIATGKAWRIELPEDCRLRSSLNSLEFIAALISIWIELLDNSLEAESCLLSQTDVTKLGLHCLIRALWKFQGRLLYLLLLLKR